MDAIDEVFFPTDQSVAAPAPDPAGAENSSDVAPGTTDAPTPKADEADKSKDEGAAPKTDDTTADKPADDADKTKDPAQDKADAEKPDADKQTDDEETDESEPGPDANTPRVRKWGKNGWQQYNSVKPTLEKVAELGGAKQLEKLVPVATAFRDPAATGAQLLGAIQQIAHPDQVQEIVWSAIESEASQKAIIEEFFGEGATLERLQAAYKAYDGTAAASKRGDDTDADDTESDEDLFLSPATRAKLAEHAELKKFKEGIEREREKGESEKTQTTTSAKVREFEQGCAGVVDKVVQEFALEPSKDDDPEESARKEFAPTFVRMGAYAVTFKNETIKKHFENARKWLEKGDTERAEAEIAPVHNALQANSTKIGKYLNRLINSDRKLQAQQAKERTDGVRPDLNKGTAATQGETSRKKSDLTTDDGVMDLAAEIGDLFRSSRAAKK
jgi:hypothetical protein